MGKIKVGDKVRVVGNSCFHGFEVGSIVTVIDVGHGGIIKVTDGIAGRYIQHDEYETIAPNRIVEGGEYTSLNGNKWKCIHTDDDYAWLAPEGMKSAAYVFNTDGTNISQGGGDYNINFEPVVEWVDTKGSWAKKGDLQPNHHQYRLRFPLIDGTPDWSQAKVTPA